MRGRYGTKDHDEAVEVMENVVKTVKEVRSITGKNIFAKHYKYNTYFDATPDENAEEEVVEEASARSEEWYEALDEVAAAETDEPMWETDMTAEAEAKAEVSAEEVPEQSEYEQISLFAPVEKPEEVQAVTELGKELSARLAEKGIVFEDALHEYARIEGIRKQLVRMLEVVVTVRKKCHCLIITGEKKSGKTTLGTYLAKLLYELSYVKTPRVAKISADRLNQLNLFEKQDQLQDVCLIVERAGEMTEETVTIVEKEELQPIEEMIIPEEVVYIEETEKTEIEKIETEQVETGTSEELETVRFPEEYVTYEVAKGDTLYGICVRFYGNLHRAKEICELNHIEDMNNILYGQKILLPQ